MLLNNLLKQAPSRQAIALIDGDLYLYRACAAAEEEIDWGDDIWSLMTDLKEAKKIFQTFIDNICDDLETGNFIIALSDKHNFRNEIEPTYKGGRKKVRKPVGYRSMKHWIKNTYRWVQTPMLEADDVLGICGSHPDHNVIMVSDDKDLKSVPAKLYRPMSQEYLDISEAEADRFFFKQALMGDATDGYSGCPSVGEKTAEKILGSRPDWSLVVKAYASKSLSENHALTQARLARILRWEDWDEKKQIVKLWEPKR